MPLHTPEEAEQILIPKLTIPWNNCSERMPPDDDTKIISRDIGDKSPFTTTGAYLNSCCRSYISYLKYNEWILYDEATWKELQKCS